MVLQSPEPELDTTNTKTPTAIPVAGERPPAGPLTTNTGYLLAERNKRVRALWTETPVATKAREYLNTHCVLSDATIREYHFGIVCLGRDADGGKLEEVLCVPVPDRGGPEFSPCVAAAKPGAKHRGQYVMFYITQTEAGIEETQCKRGPALTMYLTPATAGDLVVCEGALDAICVAQMLRKFAGREFTVIASTHANEYPNEWFTPEFWVSWQRVYFAHIREWQDHQTPFSARRDFSFSHLASITHRPVLKVGVPKDSVTNPIRNWRGYFRSGGTPEKLLSLFDEAQISGTALDMADTIKSAVPPGADVFTEGEFGDVTYDVAYNYIGGYYYYPFSVLQFSRGSKGQKEITRLTRLLRDDGRILGWARVPSRRGTSDVIAADDGTLLSRPPEVSQSATWSLDHIIGYARAAKSGSVQGRKLGEILRGMCRLFDECIWLPRPEQLFLLLFTAPVTYVQELFSAVPYLLIQGPKGSGKSELAHVLSWVSSNSTIIGAGSHAFTAAQIDQARGLIVLDDRETLAASDLDGDLLELLKVGYKRSTGVRGIIAQNRKMLRQHVYGVKAITCVSGVEEVVGTRMLRIRTAPYSKTRAAHPIRRFQASDQEIAHRLRQEMHAWTFRNVRLIHAEYAKIVQSDSRWDEITAPLRTFSALCGDSDLQSKLETALSLQEQEETVALPVEAVLSRAVEDLVRRGVTRELSITQIRNELACRFGDGTTCHADVPDPAMVTASWITRVLKGQGWFREGAVARRTRIRKKVLQRIWDLDPAKVKIVLDSLSEKPADLGPLSFCEDCKGCDYKNVCKIQKYFHPNSGQ